MALDVRFACGVDEGDVYKDADDGNDDDDGGGEDEGGGVSDEDNV